MSHIGAEKNEIAESVVDPQLLITYRYLRMALVAVLAMLTAAVLVQWKDDGRSFLPSISDYYWSPAGPVFVGALVALGVGMVVLKPESELEDVFLNIAGVLAPVVAFVPTPQAGTCVRDDAGNLSQPSQATIDGIANNIPAFLIAGAVAVVLLIVLTRVKPERIEFPELEPRAALARKLGFGFVLILFAGAVVWYVVGRKSFECGAHYAAAVPLFAGIIGVAVVNGIGKYRESDQRAKDNKTAFFNRYLVIVFLMVVVLVVGLIGRGNWGHYILFIEAGVLILFLAFWILQSLDLWDRGIRTRHGQRTLLPQSAPLPPASAP